MRQNHTPSWLLGLVVGVMVLGILFALPNLFGEDPAIQLTPADGSAPPEAVVADVEDFLQGEGLPYDQARLVDSKTVMVTFEDTAAQGDALDPLRDRYRDGYITALTTMPRMPDFMRALGLRPMALGLDLRGGVHFLFEVDLEVALEKFIEQSEGTFRQVLREANGRQGIRSQGYEVIEETNTIIYKFRDRETAVEAEREMRQISTEFDYLIGNSPDGGAFVSATMNEAALAALQARSIDQNLTTLRRRVDSLGAAEPLIQQQGLNRIVVELPGVQDPAAAERIIGATATVEFRLNDTEGDANAAARGERVPFSSRLYYHRDGFPVLLKREVIASGDNLTSATSTVSSSGGGPAVSVNLDQRGGNRMLRATTENVGKPMSVVYIESERKEVEQDDGTIDMVTEENREVISIATIQGVFSNRFEITGLNPTEASTLATLLNAGSLAAPIFKVEERTIGPSLGEQNIARGQMAILIGFVAVVIFMALYYRMFGLFANVALFANLVLIVALLSVLPAALSLPGIAGIVLTVGMSVDANVLIFERIREEIRSGNSPQASITAGYEKALSTIADANITTAIAALILAVFGTGPVRGFAVTLFIGIGTSMFTAIIGTRVLVNAWYGRRQVDALAI
ncbi:MAG: protein translocase subunit SecD [Pseudomonadota bacterium]